MFLEVTENHKKQIIGLLSIEQMWFDDNGDVRIEKAHETIHPDQSYDEIVEKLKAEQILFSTVK